MEEQEPFFPPSFIEELKRVFKIFLMALAMPFPYPKPDVKSGLIKASVVGLRIGIIVYGFALFIVPPALSPDRFSSELVRLLDLGSVSTNLKFSREL
jgi:hypothetical protein